MKSEETTKSVTERPLKERNGTAPRGDVESPIKRTSKKSLRIFESEEEEEEMMEEEKEMMEQEQEEEEEEEEEEEKKMKKKKMMEEKTMDEGGEGDDSIKAKGGDLQKEGTVQDTPQKTKEPNIVVTTPRMDTSQEVISPCSDRSADSPLNSDSAGISPSGIPKRRTARKQLPKRKLETSPTGENGDNADSDQAKTGVKRQRKETEIIADVGLQENEAMETDQSSPSTEPEVKVKKEVKEQELKVEKEKTAGTTNKQDSKVRTEESSEQEPGPKPVSPSSELKPSKAKAEKKRHSPQAKTAKSCKKPAVKEDDGGGSGAEETEKAEPAKLGKPISSFFAPRKPPAKTDKKEESVNEKTITETTSEAAGKPKKTAAGSFFGASKSELSEEQAEYNPSKSRYHPINDACWSNGQKVPYLAVARTFERIEEESARLKNIETLSNLLRSVISLSPEDLLPCIYLCLNRLGPAYEGLELGIGETILMKAVAQATGRQLDKIKAEAQEMGDLGLVAESSRSNQRTMFTPPKLIAFGVFSKLKEIARMTGNASTNKKIDIIKGLFVACRHSEARYIARSLGGKLRIGLAEQSVLAAIAQAVCLTPPGQELPPAVLDAGKGMAADARKAWIDESAMILKQTFCELPNYDTIIPVLMEHGIESLPKHCRLTPGIPLKPMLAHPTKGIGEVLKRFDEAAFTCEYKYDGERAQIHILENGEVHVYSRNQENNTTKYPDIISRIPTVKKETVTSCIIDTEAVAWDPEKKQIQPFQVLTTRKRKDVDASDIKVQVCVYAFDMLYLNGESLVKEPFAKRRQLLRESFVETDGEFMLATYMDTTSTDEISEFLDQSIKDSCEGLMVKTLEQDATYEIAKRSHNWLKLKKDYLEGVGDTLDLVVIGGYLGKGKRAGMYGGFLLASYDEESEEYQTICKIGTGFTDEDLEKHYNFLKDHVIENPRSYYRWDSATEPDHWFDTVQVWEVKCADLSISPVHKSALGLVEDKKGISLRFPRFLRIRDDKKPEDATNSFQVADLYKKQQQIQNTSSTEKGEEDFY
ncbi:DNA ligase 1 isoform X2 [Ascaphus truei]